jgi:ligand-binding sensor domain-containing protein
MKSPSLMPITFLLLILSSLHSQEGWRRLTTEDGLSSNKILTIHQAKNGHIWIGTDKGISRYNGIFENFLNGPVNSIFESTSGQVIAREVIPNYATDSNRVGIYLFDGQEWEEPDFLLDNDIWVSDVPEFAVESAGKLWISTRDGLVGFDGQKWQLYDPDVDVNWLVKAPDGRLWSESWWADSIVSFDGQKWNLEFDTDNSPLDNATTNTAFPTSTGKIILSIDEGLFQYDSVLNSITDLKLGQDNIRRIYESTEHVLWVGTDQGLFRLNNGKWRQVIDGQDINTIGQTKQGLLRVGTSNGLYQFHNGEWVLELGVAVNCFAELADGTFVVGASDGLRLKPPADETAVMRTELAGEFVSGLVLASDGTLWGRSTAGFISYDGLKWTNHGGPNSGMRRWPVHSSIYEDSQGIIWFNNGGGADLWSFSDGQLQGPRYAGWTWVFAETEQGHVIAAGKSGPYAYVEGKWTSISGYGTDPNANNSNYAAYVDDDGSIWVNGEAGIWRYHNGQWLEYRDIESKPVPWGEHFIRGPDGILRAPTSGGIYRLNSDQKWVLEWEADDSTVNPDLGDIIGRQYFIGGSRVCSIHVLASGQLVAVAEGGGLLIN